MAFVIFIASMILQHAFLEGRIIFTIFVIVAVAIIGAGWKAYDTEIQRNTVMVICFTAVSYTHLVSCVNLGIGLAQEGKKVLLIDADPQGSLTISLGYEEPRCV